MPLLEISVVPVGTNSESFSGDIERAVAVIEQNGLNYQVTPTSTIVEGDIDKLFDVAQVIHMNEIENNAQRVVTHMKIDDRKDKNITLDRQVNRIKEE
ncbi:MTH1187 family thiamine-binding protein [Alkalicoccus halolimnae]|uniref:MTH1187 family thiamine-binding protein n=1 Tax=Alkalicoccus halolimnae TaxID=1667239 RepID=A0A5C7FBL3_9BACI|nr:MTH1187 family thiamine-binding protein [Alkalicoccus halolimnae]TXF86818.1 MTH1187 family thiamine-binding protein [Alkalicoccus halolimnae]